jgi:hypothetical protein
MSEQFKNKPLKFYEFSKDVGKVTMGDMDVQLCDHVQKIEGIYFATAFYEGERKADGRADNGVYYMEISDSNLVFIPLEMLKTAKAVQDDYSQTNDMMDRLVKAIESLNTLGYERRAAA